MTLDASAIKEQQRKDWGDAAESWRRNYERLKEVAAPVTKHMLDIAGIMPGHRVLDIACGSGEPALSTAHFVGAAGFVLATDMAPEMLEVARNHAKAQGLTNIEFRLVDGEEIDVEPESFDAVTCRWGLMFMPEPVRCLAAAHRGLKVDSRIAVTVWGPPDRNPFIALPMGIARKYYKGPPLPEPNAPGGVFSFADRSKLEYVLQMAGFEEILIDEMELPMVKFDSGKDYWDYCREFIGPLRRLLSTMSQADQDAIAKEVAEAAPQGNPDGKVSLNGNPVFGTAVKRADAV